MKIDLSVYLVTDSTGPILKGRDLCAVVEEAVKGGVTLSPLILYSIDAWQCRCNGCPISGQKERHGRAD